MDYDPWESFNDKTFYFNFNVARPLRDKAGRQGLGENVSSASATESG